MVYVLGATPNHIPLKNRCPSKISNRIQHVYLTSSNGHQPPAVNYSRHPISTLSLWQHGRLDAYCSHCSPLQAPHIHNLVCNPRNYFFQVLTLHVFSRSRGLVRHCRQPQCGRPITEILHGNTRRDGKRSQQE